MSCGLVCHCGFMHNLPIYGSDYIHLPGADSGCESQLFNPPVSGLVRGSCAASPKSEGSDILECQRVNFIGYLSLRNDLIYSLKCVLECTVPT